MGNESFKRRVEGYLDAAGIRIGGNAPWDMRVINEDVYPRLIAEGSMGLGESYMEGWWECPLLDEFFNRVLRARLDEAVVSWKSLLENIRAKLFNLQKGGRAYHIGNQHYDIGNDLFRCMLDGRMIYSCAFWSDACTLDEAQEAKLALICRKLDLRPGMKLLDIGCGWGGLARFAAERHGVSVEGITVSREQVDIGREVCGGWPVDIRLGDYREVSGTYDRVVSVGMFEHVGYKNYSTYMKIVRKVLKPDGRFVLQTIGRNHTANRIDPWVGRYIFTNSMLPSPAQIARAVEGIFVMEDWQNFGADYDRTLMSWCRRFEAHWDELKERYGEMFYRMWRYYLLASAGAFRARRNQLWQIVLSPEGIPGGFRPTRDGRAA